MPYTIGRASHVAKSRVKGQGGRPAVEGHCRVTKGMADGQIPEPEQAAREERPLEFPSSTVLLQSDQEGRLRLLPGPRTLFPAAWLPGTRSHNRLVAPLPHYGPFRPVVPTFLSVKTYHGPLDFQPQSTLSCARPWFTVQTPAEPLSSPACPGRPVRARFSLISLTLVGGSLVSSMLSLTSPLSVKPSFS